MQPINDSSSIEEVLSYIVSTYGQEIYKDKQRLSNLISDLYTGDERLKRVYRRAIIEDALAGQLYALSLKPIKEREAFYNRLVSQFVEMNFYEEAFGTKVVEAFVAGMKLEIVEPISTEATEEDGEWEDEFGAIYSADRKKLIQGPDDFEDYSIREGTIVICDGAFYDSVCFNKIVIPNSVTNIGDEAFLSCFGLKNIIVQKNNKTYKSIDGVLYSYNLQQIICYPKEKEGQIFIIPNSVTHIANGAFCSCCNLTSIEIPNNITHIGDGAFTNCYNLTNITVQENNKTYKSIDGVLYSYNLQQIIRYPEGKEEQVFIIPNSVTNIGNKAFDGCKNLTDIIVQENNKSYKSIDGVLYSYNLQQIICYPQGKKKQIFLIPNNVTHIGNHAFLDCNYLTDIITYSNSITHIGDMAFEGCCNLREIMIPNSIKIIGYDAFRGCLKLTSIIIGEGSLSKFQELLPEYTHILSEQTNIKQAVLFAFKKLCMNRMEKNECNHSKSSVF